MTGSFTVKGQRPLSYMRQTVDGETQWPPRFCKLELVFGAVRLALTDPRRLARVTLVTGDIARAPALLALGPDAWLDLPPPGESPHANVRAAQP